MDMRGKKHELSAVSSSHVCFNTFCIPRCGSKRHTLYSFEDNSIELAARRRVYRETNVCAKSVRWVSSNMRRLSENVFDSLAASIYCLERHAGVGS